MESIKKAIIPVAGFGTRFLPITKTVPKTMLPILDKPVIHYLVEEAQSIGCEEIIIVLSKYQKIVENYFERFEELENNLRSKAKDTLLQQIKGIGANVKLRFVYQEDQLGDGHAILCAEQYIDNEPFLVLFGDDIIAPSPVKKMYDLYIKKNKPVLVLDQVETIDIPKYGIVEPDNIRKDYMEITDIIEKPSIDDAPSNYGVVGKYICTYDIMELLKKGLKSSDGEIRLAEALKEYMKISSVVGVKFEGKRYDLGNKYGFFEATIDYALTDKKLQPRAENYIKKIFFKLRQ